MMLDVATKAFLGFGYYREHVGVAESLGHLPALFIAFRLHFFETIEEKAVDQRMLTQEAVDHRHCRTEEVPQTAQATIGFQPLNLGFVYLGTSPERIDDGYSRRLRHVFPKLPPAWAI